MRVQTKMKEKIMIVTQAFDFCKVIYSIKMKSKYNDGYSGRHSAITFPKEKLWWLSNCTWGRSCACAITFYLFHISLTNADST